MESSQPGPRILDLVVELGISRMASFVGDSADTMYRPRICVLVDHSSGAILNFDLSKPDDTEASHITSALDKLGQQLSGFPRQILTRSPQISQSFKVPLQKLGIDVVVRESLPMADAALASLASGPLGGGKKEKSLMSVAGMTLDHMIAFAEAGKLFYEAKPWQHLWDDDLIEIESPKGPKGTFGTQVLGAMGQTMGLGFVASREAHEKLQAGGEFPKGVGVWNLLYNVLDELPFEDGELWEQHNLPVADERAYPRFARYTASAGMNQPKHAELVWAEGLLRALAASTEADFDSGRWEKQVVTFAGPTIYKLSMPILLEQLNTAAAPKAQMESPQVMMERMMRGMRQEIAKLDHTPTEKDLQEITHRINSGKLTPAFVPSTPAEKAQELCYQARSARGRRIVQLARQALEIDPDCADAFLILAEQTSADQPEIPLLEKAVQAGERQLGPEFFKKNAGHFWGVTESRPYMRAVYALAVELLNEDQTEAGIAQLQKLLELNPGDNQGSRYMLLQAYLAANRLDDLDKLLNHTQYTDDSSPEWTYTRALLVYRRGGDTPVARQQLAKAFKEDPIVAKIMTGGQLPQEAAASYGIETSMQAAEILFTAWQETNGALQWLKSATDSTAKKAAAWQRDRDKKPKKKKR